MTPRIVFSPLSHRWYVLTRYQAKAGRDAVTGKPCRYVVARAGAKHDVTAQMDAIFAARRRGRR